MKTGLKKRAVVKFTALYKVQSDI